MKTVIKIITIFAGIILGGYLGELALSVPVLSFLAWGKELGFTQPIVLDLNIIKITLGFVCKLNIAGILGLIISLILVKKVL